jgi:hypothetical protein
MQQSNNTAEPEDNDLQSAKGSDAGLFYGSFENAMLKELLVRPIVRIPTGNVRSEYPTDHGPPCRQTCGSARRFIYLKGGFSSKKHRAGCGNCSPTTIVCRVLLKCVMGQLGPGKEWAAAKRVSPLLS